jgi:hypothetical protein
MARISTRWPGDRIMADDGRTTGPTGGIEKSRRPKLPSQSRRRFLIADAMVLIAATAIGIALARGGGVRFVRDGVNLAVWRALATRAASDIVTSDSY